MKPVFVALLTASLVLGNTATGFAQTETLLRVRTAGDLAELCGASRTEAKGPERINYCHGYTEGGLEMELRREKAIKKNLICIPTPAPTRSATLTEFVGWVRSMPTHAAQPALDGFFMFMSERFPCGKEAGTK